METLFLMIDTAALMVAIYFSVRNEKARGKDEEGPFRIRPFVPVAPPPIKRRGRPL